jgi:hypothetical protein
MPSLNPVAGQVAHIKACWVDITDPQEQAYAEKRRQTRAERTLATMEEAALQVTKEK